MREHLLQCDWNRAAALLLRTDAAERCSAHILQQPCMLDGWQHSFCPKRIVCSVLVTQPPLTRMPEGCAESCWAHIACRALAVTAAGHLVHNRLCSLSPVWPWCTAHLVHGGHCGVVGRSVLSRIPPEGSCRELAACWDDDGASCGERGQQTCSKRLNPCQVLLYGRQLD